MNDNMTDSMWIKANSTRNYRIRRRGEVDGLGLIAATIVNISERACRVMGGDQAAAFIGRRSSLAGRKPG